MQHRLTWLAIILTFIFLIPGEIAGYFAGYMYRYILDGFLVGSGSLFDLMTNGWGTPVFLEVSSVLVQGLVAGAIAGFFCTKIIKRADYHSVAYANSALVIAFTVIGLVLGLAKEGPRMADVAMIMNSIGVIGSLFTVAQQMAADRQRAPAMSATSTGER